MGGKKSPPRRLVRNIEKGHCWNKKSPPRREILRRDIIGGKKSPPRIVFKENPEQVVTRRRGSSILQRARTQIREIS